MPGSTAFTNEDVEQILRVVDRLSDVEVRIEIGDLKLHVRKFANGVSAPAATTLSEPAVAIAGDAHAAASPAPAPLPATSPTAAAAAKVPEGAVAIRAPMLGRFFRAPSPSEPPYVEVGERVGPDDPVCLIEVMKLFTTVNAGLKGTIISVSVANGEMVEHGQMLFLVQPD
jgi:acetyl-CoA carboxylase biotin carboxyl carrier protein